jgi:hypothetical protein
MNKRSEFLFMTDMDFSLHQTGISNIVVTSPASSGGSGLKSWAGDWLS